MVNNIIRAKYIFVENNKMEILLFNYSFLQIKITLKLNFGK